MTVGDEFPGDDNEGLKRIQHDLYFSSSGVTLLCRAADRRYASAIRLLSVSSDLWEAMKQHNEKYYSGCEFSVIEGQVIQRFDHRVLQSAYDMIAAAFRFRNKDLWAPLFADLEDTKAVMMKAWLAFWPSEVRRLAENDEITKAILTAVAFQNGERGYAAEKELGVLLRSEYRDMFVNEHARHACGNGK
jgi:hypothetical protein